VIRKSRVREVRGKHVLIVAFLLDTERKVSMSLPLCAVGHAGAPELSAILGTCGVGERGFWYLDALVKERRPDVNDIGPAVESQRVATASQEYDLVPPGAGSKATGEPRFARGRRGSLIWIAHHELLGRAVRQGLEIKVLETNGCIRDGAK
jgi:hypothetical protein